MAGSLSDLTGLATEEDWIRLRVFQRMASLIILTEYFIFLKPYTPSFFTDHLI